MPTNRMIRNIVLIHETIWSLTCITSRKHSQLVSDVTDQMHDVDRGFDQIQVLQAQGHEMFSKNDDVEAEIRSKETKDLFDRAEAILLAMTATVNCTNNVNASGCNGTNTERERPVYEDRSCRCGCNEDLPVFVRDLGRRLGERSRIRAKNEVDGGSCLSACCWYRSKKRAID